MMRVVLTGLALSAGMGWSFDSQAQLLPPPPMQPLPPGATPAQPTWGYPAQQPMAPMAPPANATVQQLNAGDASGSFRGLEIAWTNLEAGGGYVHMPAKTLYGQPSAGGAAFGLGVGARFITWTLGVRARVMPLSKFTLVQAMLEAGYHLPVGAWDPYLNIRGGYVTALFKAQNLELLPGETVNAPAPPNPRGVDVGLSTGDDYYFNALFSLGVDVSFDTLFLSYPAVSDAGTVLLPSSSGISYVVTGSLHAGLHFDL